MSIIKIDLSLLKFLPAPIFEGKAKLDIFTTQEQLAVVTASMTDPEVKLMYDRLLNASYITIEDPDMVRGLDLLVHKKILTFERKSEIESLMSNHTQIAPTI